mmetsp:Transcript_87262/g.271051  ORF Transcript_87262/g.271051 Transcript_87262/m.271051 type:complete len:240 (+) Transcript_87262:339-1058(+)
MSPQEVAGHYAGCSVDASQAMHRHGTALQVRPDGLLDLIVEAVLVAVRHVVPLVHLPADEPGMPVRAAGADLVEAGLHSGLILVAIDDQGEVLKDPLLWQRPYQRRLVAQDQLLRQPERHFGNDMVVCPRRNLRAQLFVAEHWVRLMPASDAVDKIGRNLASVSALAQRGRWRACVEQNRTFSLPEGLDGALVDDLQWLRVGRLQRLSDVLKAQEGMPPSFILRNADVDQLQGHLVGGR